MDPLQDVQPDEKGILRAKPKWASSSAKGAGARAEGSVKEGAGGGGAGGAKIRREEPPE